MAVAVLIGLLVCSCISCNTFTKPDEENTYDDQDPISKIRYNEISVKFNCKVIDTPAGKRDIDLMDFGRQYNNVICYLDKLDIISIKKVCPKRVYGEVNIINRRGKAVTLPEMSQLIKITFNKDKYSWRDIEKIVYDLEQMKQVQYVSAFGFIGYN
ncbi:hypothetical protein ACFLT7_07125 [candidate division KSB1 bacterium]